MLRTAACETCGATDGVTEVLVSGDQGERRMRMCAECKAERLVKRRVRVRQAHRRRRTVPSWLGYAILALGTAVLLVVGAVGLFGGEDEEPPECYPGAGFSCPAQP